MSVTVRDVEYVAKLARLEFTEEQKQKFTEDLNGILNYVEMLKEVDTDNVEISIGAYRVENALREDVVKPSFDRESLLKNAPDAQEGFVKVPKVIE